MKTNYCAICNKEPISQRFNGLTLGEKCLSFYGLKGVKSSSLQNLSNQGKNTSNQTKYHGMTKGLAIDPQVTLEVLKKTHPELIHQVVQKFPYLGMRTFVDTLTCGELDKLQENASFMQVRTLVLSLVHTLNNNFKSFLEDKLHEGLTLAEAQIAGIKEFLHLPEYQPLTFEEIYTQGVVSQEQINRVISAFQVASTLIPDRYKQSTPVPTIIIKGPDDKSPSFASAAEKSLIVLNLQTNLITQIAEALHEYLHLIEQFNPEINYTTNKFIMDKTNLCQKTIKEIGETYRKPFLPSAASVLVYQGPFIDPYIGRTYGSIDPTLKKLVGTEVLSVGGEALLMNPTNFSLRDPEHFKLIVQVLQGKI